VLKHLRSSRYVHPERLYEELLRLAGELATFATPERRAREYPVYDHDNLENVFGPLIRDIQDFLSARLGRRAIRLEIIEALRAKAAVDKFAGKERLLVQFTRTLLHEHTLPDELFARMESEFGRAKFIEAVGLLGHYMTIGTVIRMFDVKPPEGSKTF